MEEEGQGQLLWDGTPGAARRRVLSVLFRSVGRLLPLSHVTRVLRMEAEGHHGTKQATVASGFKSPPPPVAAVAAAAADRGPLSPGSSVVHVVVVAMSPLRRAPAPRSALHAPPTAPPTRWGDGRAYGIAGPCSWDLKAACHQGPAQCALCPRRPARS